MQTYALVDGGGNVVNLVNWDGQSTWQSPTGLTAVPATSVAAIGGTYANGAFSPPAPPAAPTLTPAQQLAVALTAGVTINSTGTSALDGVYPLDQATLDDIVSVSDAIANGKGFFGMASVTFANAAGSYTFTDTTLFLNWADAVGSYVAQCKLTARALAAGVSASWPATTVTIA